MQENLFLAGEYVNFYQTSIASRKTIFRVEPKTVENKALTEQMNGVLGLLHQHMQLHQYEEEKFIPKVTNFNPVTGELELTISANLATAVPTVVIAYNEIVIDQRNAAWITRQAFQLASLANGAGIVLPFSPENFLVCYKSENFVLLDWTTAQLYKNSQTDATVAQQQVVDLANLLVDMVDYQGATSGGKMDNLGLWDFMQKAVGGAFLSVTEAEQALNHILN